MADRKSFLLRLEDDMYERLKRWADDEFRSLHGQIEYLLDKALREAGRKKQQGSKREPGAPD